MPSHGLVVAQFRFDRSAYWLPRPARAVAETISCSPFWAMRFSTYDGAAHPNAPGTLCLVSPTPSSIPVPDASFTIGPKFAMDTAEFSTDAAPDGAQLTVAPPICCQARTLRDPLYVHTVPALRITGARGFPMGEPYNQLDDEGFRRFRVAVLDNRGKSIRAWIERRKAVLAERLPHLSDALYDQSDWDLFSGSSPDFGQLTRNNPHMYCFDFITDGPIPFQDKPPYLYEQIFIFLQLCKDYRWRGVENTVEYVRAVRRDIQDPQSVIEPSGYDEYDSIALAHAPAQRLLKEDMAFRAHFAPFASLSKLGFTRHVDVGDSMSDRGDSSGHRSDGTPITSTSIKSMSEGKGGDSPGHSGNDSGGDGTASDAAKPSLCANSLGDGKLDSTGGREPDSRGPRGLHAVQLGFSRTSLWFFPRSNPTLPCHFPRVPMPSNPRVVVLDMFGVVLDREAAIRNALLPWLPTARRRPRDPSEAVKLYMELEALTARSHRTRATSLPTVVHIALSALAGKLDLAPSSHAAFLAHAMAHILSPRLHDDAVQSVRRLSQQGYTVVGLSPFSCNSPDALQSVVLSGMRVFPVTIPAHAHVPAAFFEQLRAWCESSDGAARVSLAASEVLVVGGGMGRVLAAAVADAHPTVLVRRLEGIECRVEFVVGVDDGSPHPSAVVDGLAALCDVLCIESPLS